MNIVTYLRVSTEEQTIEPQRIELASYCERNGWTIEAEYSDVISGSKAARVGLNAMLERCRQGGIAAVVVVKIDRLGRSSLNVFTLVRKLADMGTAVICTSQGIDTRNENPCGKMMLAVMAAFAEMERDFIIERTKSGLAAARARGVKLGAPSKKLPGTEHERIEIVTKWRNDGMPGGYRGLGQLLGGVSGATAHRVAAKVKMARELAEEAPPV